MTPALVLAGRVLVLDVWGESATVPTAALTIVCVLMVMVTMFASAYGEQARWSRAQQQGIGVVTAVALAGGVVMTTGVKPDGIVIAAMLSTASFVLASSMPAVVARLPEELDASLLRHWAARIAWVLVTVAVVYKGVTLSTYMADARRTEASLFPSNDFFVHHCCLTAYLNGSALNESGVGNVYHTDLVPATRTATPAQPLPPIIDTGHFTVDPYQYPPPFLGLVRVARSVSRNFYVLRALWFAAGMVVVCVGTLILAIWVGGRAGAMSALLLPMVWGAPPTLTGLQFGNVHVVLVVLAVLAMVAFERGRPLVGASLLALAILTKISPGLLLLYLGLRGRRSAVLLTLLVMGLMSAAALWLLGPEIFVAFAEYHLPRLMSGEAFSFLFVHAGDVVANASWFGVPAKLDALGLMDSSWSVARTLGRIYTVVLLGLTVVVARAGPRRSEMACIWLALVSLAALRSPFAPSYVAVSTIGLLSIVAGEVRTVRGGVVLAAVWAGLSWLPPMTQWIGTEVTVVASLLHQILTYGFLGWVVVRVHRRRRRARID